jgi:hypothetical protein
MLINDEDKNKRLASDENLLNRLAKRAARVGNSLLISPETLGRKPEIPNIPPLIKEIAATTASCGIATNKEMARSFGISAQTVSNVRSGVGIANKDIQKKIDENLGQIRDVAIDRLMQSLGLMDDEKLANTKARDLSSIAANLSKVIDKSLPRADTNPLSGVQVIFYSPRMKDISDYEVIDIERTA